MVPRARSRRRWSRGPAVGLHEVIVPAHAKAGQPSFKATRRINDAHQIEEVGAKLRAMMPWIAKNKLVDKGRN